MAANDLLKTADLLKKSGKTLSIAESCTGGLLGEQITSVPGSSAYFRGGVITYSDRAKMDLLGVSKKSLERHGAVSETVAKEMAKNVRRLLKSDYGIGITGIAGPGGGTKTKPVGLVFIAVSDRKKVVCRKFRFSGTRSRIRSRSSEAALRLFLKKTV